MIPFLPAAVPWKLIGAAIAIIFVFGLGFKYGDDWRSAKCDKLLMEEKERYEQLAVSVREQNKSIENLKAQTDTAIVLRQAAEDRLRERELDRRSREKKITEYVAKDCEDALGNWWRNR